MIESCDKKKSYKLICNRVTGGMRQGRFADRVSHGHVSRNAKVKSNPARLISRQR